MRGLDRDEVFDREVDAMAAAVGVEAHVHAADLDGADQLGRHPDHPVVAASVFKVPVLWELCRQAVDGAIDPTASITVPPDGRTAGGAGLSAMLDTAQLSVRDLAYLMMAVSDNHATDVIIELVGLDAINAAMAELGLVHTRLVTDCAGLWDSISHDIGASAGDDLLSHPDDQLAARVRSAAAFDPARTSATTAREATTLLSSIWLDRGADPRACAQMRRILGLQVWPHRLSSGFPDSRVKVSGKTGTMTYVRNEAGVVEYPDGGRYAVSVFLRDPREESRNPDADRLIGDLGRLAVDLLRGDERRSR